MQNKKHINAMQSSKSRQTKYKSQQTRDERYNSPIALSLDLDCVKSSVN